MAEQIDVAAVMAAKVAALTADLDAILPRDSAEKTNAKEAFRLGLLWVGAAVEGS